VSNTSAAFKEAALTTPITWILIQAWNDDTQVWDTIERERGTAQMLEDADLSAGDLSCEPGTEFRLALVGEDDYEVLAERIVQAS
jgi:hypothetical protein